MTLYARSLAMIGVVLVLVAGAACAPKDPEVRRSNAKTEAARQEKVKVEGFDYLQYFAYRLAELKRVIEVVSGAPVEQITQKKSVLCGQVTLDRRAGNQRMIRVMTANCARDSAQADGPKAKLNGEEYYQVTLDDQGQVLRITAQSLGPLLVEGRISTGDLKDSRYTLKERRQLVVDWLRSEGSRRIYRFNQAVDWSWSQYLTTKAFNAEDDGRNQLEVVGEIDLLSGVTDAIRLEELHLTADLRREIKERGRRPRGSTPDRTTHNLTLRLTSKGLTFPESSCGLPNGELEVATFRSTKSDDRLTKAKERRIVFSDQGIYAVGPGRTQPWVDCAGPDKGVPALGPGEIGQRIPYGLMFFK